MPGRTTGTARSVAVALVGALALAGSLALAPTPMAVAAPRASRALLPPDNPGESIPASPAFETSCSHPQFDDSASCRTTTLEAIANARALEGLGPMVLPHNWSSLSKAEQIFTAINIERVDRGVAPMTGLVKELNDASALGATALVDPSLPAGYPFTGMGTIMAGGQSSVLGALYEWMYFDGPKSHNPDCVETSPGVLSAGCWMHRTIILKAWADNPSTVGAAATMTTYNGHAMTGYAALMVGDKWGRSHSYTFTWAHELPYFGDVPAAPAKPSLAVTGARKVKGTWTVPYYTGTTALTGYRLTLTVDGVAQAAVDVSASTLTTTFDVPDGTAVKLAVRALNRSGPGPAATSDLVVAPFPTISAFVSRCYQDLVGRAPTSSELLAGVGGIQGGQTPRAFVVALRGGSDATGNVDPATRLYFAYFLRVPDPGGLNHWIGKRRRGTSLYSISSAFAASTEFTRRYGSLTNAQFVDLVYQNVLGRAGDPTGAAYWTRQLDTKAKTRGQVMVGYSESSEYKRKSKPSVDVAVGWIQLLGKAPTKDVFDSQVSDLAGGDPLAGLVGELLDTDEYAQRVG